MPGIAEHGPLAEGLPQDVRLDRQGREPDPVESVSDLSTRMTEGMSSSLGGYGQRLRGHQQRGEVEGSGTSGDSRELSLVSEEIDRGWDYDPAYWAQGPGGHDGTTLEDDLLDDELAIMRDLAVDAGSRERIQPVESEASSAERPDWRRTLASEDDEPPTLDEMIARGWRVVRNTLAPPNRGIYREPDPVLPPAGDPDQETPTWMGVSTQMPVRPRSNDPWEPQRGFSGTSRVRDDSSESDGSFEQLEPRP